MENYEIIKSYLETFPQGTTVDTVINNIDKAVKQFNEAKEKREMSKYIGKCFLREEYDDDQLIVRFIFKPKEITPDKLLKGIVIIIPDGGMFSEEVTMKTEDVDRLTEEVNLESVSEVLFSKDHRLSKAKPTKN